MKALIVEDDPNISESVSLCIQLRWNGITATIAAEGLKGVNLAKNDVYDFIILDLNLPDISGFEVLKRIRKFSNIPIIIVSVRKSEADKIKGLELGANDYIVKPFHQADLITRISAVMRRNEIAQSQIEN